MGRKKVLKMHAKDFVGLCLKCDEFERNSKNGELSFSDVLVNKTCSWGVFGEDGLDVAGEVLEGEVTVEGEVSVNFNVDVSKMVDLLEILGNLGIGK